MRRFTRLTNGFSKRFDNHAYAVARHFMCMKPRATPQEPRRPVSADSAMAAGFADHIWTCEEIAGLLD